MVKCMMARLFKGKGGWIMKLNRLRMSSENGVTLKVRDETLAKQRGTYLVQIRQTLCGIVIADRVGVIPGV